MKMSTYKVNQKRSKKKFVSFQLFIFQIYALLVTFEGFPVFEIRKNLDLRKISGVTNIFLKSRFVCTEVFLTFLLQILLVD